MSLNKGQLIGYARVSSSGQSLDIQIDKLTQFGCQKIYKEKLTGMDQNRPALLQCLDYVREDDTLVITKLDRMARSALHLGQIAEKLETKKVNFIVLDQNIDTTTPHGKLMFNMLASFAEFENGIRKERQAEGIKKAIQKGVKFGRPQKVTPKTVEQFHMLANQGLSAADIMNKLDISRRTYYAIKSGSHKCCA